MPLKCLTNAVLQGRIHQQTHGHDHQEGDDPLGCFEVERGGQTRGIFQAATPALHRRLAFVACQQHWRWPLGGVECVGGQGETTVRVDEGLSGRTRGGPGPRDLVDHLSGLYAVSSRERESPLEARPWPAARLGPRRLGRRARVPEHG